MSAEIYSASGNNASLQGTTVGGIKPLHRFIKGQPKIIGVRHTHAQITLYQIPIDQYFPRLKLFFDFLSDHHGGLGLLFRHRFHRVHDKHCSTHMDSHPAWLLSGSAGW